MGTARGEVNGRWMCLFALCVEDGHTLNKNLHCGYLMCMLRVGTSWLDVTYNQLFNGAHVGLVFVAHMCTLQPLVYIEVSLGCGV